MSIHFGPAGNEDAFAKAGHKSSLDAPAYVAALGLNAYEYQCGRGVNIGADKAKLLGERAAAHGVQISLHAPYFISLASPEEKKRENSIRYILESCAAVDAMGGNRVIIHPGAPVGKPREEAMVLALETMQAARAAADAAGFSHILLCQETMGKQNQLGTLAEVCNFCRLADGIIPCVDFGHINAREGGSLATREDFASLLDRLADGVGEEKARIFHSHFSHIEYSTGGEVRHLTFDEEVYGPFFEPLAEELARRGWTPTIICESAGTQAQDAARMQAAYLAACAAK
ncbi:MAG: TIM barrel protein [Clostridia bacterium]|nr:TIM barrel protein [Clostridia bacterium]